jgi:hypothetical protein
MVTGAVAAIVYGEPQSSLGVRARLLKAPAMSSIAMFA